MWERYRAVRLAALAESPEMFGSSYECEVEFGESDWRQRALRPATFLAVRDGVDVGMAGVYEFDSGWRLMGVWLRPEVRGSGALDVLVDACVAVARDHGAPSVSLLVMEDNPRGIQAYGRNRFVLTGEREVTEDGRCELVMARALV